MHIVQLNIEVKYTRVKAALYTEYNIVWLLFAIATIVFSNKLRTCAHCITYIGIDIIYYIQ